MDLFENYINILHNTSLSYIYFRVLIFTKHIEYGKSTFTIFNGLSIEPGSCKSTISVGFCRELSFLLYCTVYTYFKKLIFWTVIIEHIFESKRKKKVSLKRNDYFSIYRAFTDWRNSHKFHEKMPDTRISHPRIIPACK